MFYVSYSYQYLPYSKKGKFNINSWQIRIPLAIKAMMLWHLMERQEKFTAYLRMRMKKKNNILIFLRIIQPCRALKGSLGPPGINGHTLKITVLDLQWRKWSTNCEKEEKKLAPDFFFFDNHLKPVWQSFYGAFYFFMQKPQVILIPYLKRLTNTGVIILLISLIFCRTCFT